MKIYSKNYKSGDRNLNMLRPYGDTMDDAMVQLSFSLPVPCDEKGARAAAVLAGKMGMTDPYVAHMRKLDDEFSFYVVYGAVSHTVDYEGIIIPDEGDKTMSMDEIDEYIRRYIGRKVIVIGASTGTDAHTVGIDAIMNMKGYAGHFGLERYEMIEAYNLGSQVPNEELIRKAVELRADVLLISQTVTQKNIHIGNLTELIDMLEAEGLREKLIVICGGSRITRELAKELGYDAGFGSQKYAEDVAAFFAAEMVKRGQTPGYE